MLSWEHLQDKQLDEKKKILKMNTGMLKCLGNGLTGQGREAISFALDVLLHSGVHLEHACTALMSQRTELGIREASHLHRELGARGLG